MLHPISEPDPIVSFPPSRSVLQTIDCSRIDLTFPFYLLIVAVVLSRFRRASFWTTLSFSFGCVGFLLPFFRLFLPVSVKEPLLVFRLLYALFLPFFRFGSSVLDYLFRFICFSTKKAHFCAFRLFYIVFQIAFATSLMPSLFWMACLSGFLFSRLSQPISLTGRTI